VNPIKKHTIEYACICNTGKVRRNNEDNFYCDGQYREDVNSVDESVLVGTVGSDTNELFAVFDGMGGEACGEVAAFVAASHAALFAESRAEYEEYLYELAEHLNEKVREETEARSLVLMGATAAMLQISKDDVYILNAGDSRIYKLSAHELRRISKDHISPAHGGKAITRFLGMPEGYSLNPYIARGKYKAGDLFLLCSDGVTDMLDDGEIAAILDEKAPAEALCRSLVDAALRNGGVDNTTAIVLKIKN
jgi:protein phosphatase